MTDERISELEELCAEATPGPWDMEYEDGVATDWVLALGGDAQVAFAEDGSHDARFISVSRAALPEALAEIRRLKAHFIVVFNRLEHNREAREEIGLVMKELGIPLTGVGADSKTPEQHLCWIPGMGIGLDK